MDVRVGPRRSKVALGRRPAGRSAPAERSESVIAQLSSLLRALVSSPYRRRLGLLAAGIVLVICANSVGQIRLNAWQGAFFDAIEQRDLASFGTQLLVFGLIGGGLLVLVVAQTWLREMIQVRLREWLTHDLLDRWLAPKRA
ncbi:MAG: ABC transporter ATP-binding protein/permease, partial [Geminicoccaceae bacterium]